MERLADALTSNKPPYGVNERVVDQTGLKGVFNINLSVNAINTGNILTFADYEELRSATFDFFSRAIEMQYGLKLEHRKVLLESLIIDGGNKIPTEN